MAEYSETGKCIRSTGMQVGLPSSRSGTGNSINYTVTTYLPGTVQ
jgi:hypothetical protein